MVPAVVPGCQAQASEQGVGVRAWPAYPHAAAGRVALVVLAVAVLWQPPQALRQAQRLAQRLAQQQAQQAQRQSPPHVLCSGCVAWEPALSLVGVAHGCGSAHVASALAQASALPQAQPQVQALAAVLAVA